MSFSNVVLILVLLDMSQKWNMGAVKHENDEEGNNQQQRLSPQQYKFQPNKQKTNKKQRRSQNAAWKDSPNLHENDKNKHSALATKGQVPDQEPISVVQRLEAIQEQRRKKYGGFYTSQDMWQELKRERAEKRNKFKTPPKYTTFQKQYQNPSYCNPQNALINNEDEQTIKRRLQKFGTGPSYPEWKSNMQSHGSRLGQSYSELSQQTWPKRSKEGRNQEWSFNKRPFVEKRQDYKK